MLYIILILIQKVEVFWLAYEVTIVKMLYEDKEDSDYVVLSARLEEVHLIVASIHHITLEFLFLGGVTYMCTIRIHIWGSKTKIYKRYFLIFAIDHNVIWFEVIENHAWLMNHLEDVY